MIYSSDYPTLQASIDAAYAAGGDLVRFSSGRNFTADRLHMRTNVHLLGAPDTVVTWLDEYSGNSLALFGDDAKNVSIRYIDFDSQNRGKFSLEVYLCENVNIEHVTCRNNNYDGIYFFAGGKQINLIDVTVRESERSGFVLIDTSDVVFDKCRSINVKMSHFDIEPNTDEQSVRNITFKNGELRDEDPAYNAVAFQATFGHGSGDTIRILDNDVDVGETFGQFIRMSNLFISGNVAKVHSQVDSSELALFNLVDNAQVVGNTIEDLGDAGGKGMLIKDVNYSDFLRNTLLLNERNTEGVRVYRGEGDQLNRNRIFDCGGDGIVVSWCKCSVKSNYTNKNIFINGEGIDVFENTCYDLIFSPHCGDIQERDNRLLK